MARTVFVAGTGRSGTTWLAEIINHRQDFRLIFEPFRVDKVDLGESFRHRQYLRPNDTRIEFTEPVRRILSGEIENEWTDSLSPLKDADDIIVKSIRANLILKWLKVNFPEVPVVFILRHPCAVARSMLSLGWHPALDQFFLSQSELVDDFIHPFVDNIEAAADPFEKIIYLWCIENYVPLRQFEPGEIHIVFYEHLCRDPKRPVNDLFAFLDWDYEESVFGVVKSPSAQVQADSAVLTGQDQVNAWRSGISPSQRERAMQILGLFGLDEIYSRNGLPNSQEAVQFMRAKRSV
jgi:hypothetical protein